MAQSVPQDRRGVIHGDGFIPFYFAIDVARRCDQRQFNMLVKQYQSLQDELRLNGALDGFPDSLVPRLEGVGGGARVVAEGPYSSIVNPLVMVRSFGGQPVCLSGALGTGPVAEAIRPALAVHGVSFRPHILSGGDSPIELSIRDRSGNQQTVRLYGVARRQFRCTYHSPQHPAAGFVLSRYNRGRDQAIRDVFKTGGLTSLRIAKPSRYVSLTDYLDLLPVSRMIVVSYRDGVMRRLARKLNIGKLSRDWPQRWDHHASELASRLSEGQQSSRLIVLVFQHETTFYLPGLSPVTYCPSKQYDCRSRAGRIQGACVAVALKDSARLPENDQQLSVFGEQAVQAAFFGTEDRPTFYPPPTFEPKSSWIVEH